MTLAVRRSKSTKYRGVITSTQYKAANNPLHVFADQRVVETVGLFFVYVPLLGSSPRVVLVAKSRMDWMEMPCWVAALEIYKEPNIASPGTGGVLGNNKLISTSEFVILLGARDSWSYKSVVVTSYPNKSPRMIREQAELNNSV